MTETHCEEPLPAELRRRVLRRVLEIVRGGRGWYQQTWSTDCVGASNAEGSCRTMACVAGHIVHESAALGWKVGQGIGWGQAAALLAGIPPSCADVLFDADADQEIVVCLLRLLLEDFDERGLLERLLPQLERIGYRRHRFTADVALRLRCLQMVENLRDGERS